MFFYRPWLRTPSDDKIFNRPVDVYGIYGNYFSHQSWGYGVLLGLTLICSIILNGSFLMSFWTFREQKSHVPSVYLLFFTLRDLAVTIFLLPATISWMVFNEGRWNDGSAWCSIAGFLDFFLAAEYPALILAFCVVCITRKVKRYYDDFFDPEYEEEDENRRVDEFIQGIPGTVPGVTVVGSPNNSRPPSIIHQPHGKFISSSPPSMAYSDLSGKRRLTPGGGFHNASRAASIAGGSSMRSNQYLKPPQPSFRASSPLREETNSADLWDAASLDYPGRHSPHFREPEEEEEETDIGPPRFHKWHYIMIGATWAIALSFGITAGMYMVYYPNTQTCMLLANPFENPNEILDPGYNFLLANVVLTYLVPIGAFLVLYIVVYMKKTKDTKFQRYTKLILAIFLVFIVSRTPMDKIQLEGLIEASSGAKRLNSPPYAIEHEILVIWASFLPAILHPIIFLVFISEYRRGAAIGWKKIGGCHQTPPKPQSVVESRLQKDSKPQESLTKETEFL